MKPVLDGLPKTNLFELIFESIEEGVFTTDFEFKITSFNRGAEEITGFSREQAVGQRCFDIFRTDHCQKQCALRNTLSKGVPVKNVRVNILTRDGATKPISVNTSILRGQSGEMSGAVEIFRDLSPIEELRKQMSGSRSFESLVSRNREMHDIFELLPDVAQSECNVLIQGPSGSGKELIARALHNLSPRKENPYIRVNCAALPSTLLESELFGYVKGAFTDARRDKPGRFLQADHGTILLDEIADMSVTLQAKLLRVLQEGEIQPLGSTKTLSIDTRVIASTNQLLKDMVKKGTFREDLYYRMNVITIDLPPMARRREDVPILTDHFVQKMRLKTGKEIHSVSDEVLERLLVYHYPGNVRELENIIEHAFVLCKSETIELRHLPRYMTESLPGGDAASPEQNHFMDNAEQRILEEALKECGGNRLAVAKKLGIHRTTLWRKLKKYGLE